MTQIEVTFLGTTAGVPTPHRNQAAIYVRYQSENEFCYLFDCGEGTQRQIFASGLNFMRISDIFITHWHADHFAGILGLMETMNLEKRTKPLTIFGPEADRFVEDLLDLGYASKRYDVIAQPVPFEGTEITTLVDNDEFYICSIPAKHGIPAVAYAFVERDRIKIDKSKAKSLGLPEKGPIFKKIKESGSVKFKDKVVKLEDIAKIEKGKKFVYSGDTMPCKNVITLSQGADVLAHDSTFFEEDDDNHRHTSVGDVLKLAEEAGVKQLILTHISRRYQLDELKEKIEGHPNVKIAKDFMKIVID